MYLLPQPIFLRKLEHMFSSLYCTDYTSGTGNKENSIKRNKIYLDIMKYL